MNWSTPQSLRAELQKQWERGELLREAVTGDSRFPLRFKLKMPGSADITHHFERVRHWSQTLTAMRHIRLEWQEVRHRVQGVQQLPVAVWIESREDALLWLGKQREWSSFISLTDMTRSACPALLAWLAKRPLQALEVADEWPQLLAVVNWMLEHPKPAIYLRQVDLPGVHSKLIETHRAILAECLDMALPMESVDSSRTGVSQFAGRYGFLEKPVRIRFRPLDPDITLIAGITCPDLTLDAGSFSQLVMDIRRVIVTENETNFLAMPPMPGTIAIFGAGYGWDALARARWLEKCDLYYWGDIDTHGFAILDSLRAHFPHVISLLMDKATLEAHAMFWGKEDRQHTGHLERLSQEEQQLYQDLRDNRIQPGLRLEQEHIGYGWACQAMAGMFCVDR
jgi:hypothetical protein